MGSPAFNRMRLILVRDVVDVVNKQVAIAVTNIPQPSGPSNTTTNRQERDEDQVRQTHNGRASITGRERPATLRPLWPSDPRRAGACSSRRAHERGRVNAARRMSFPPSVGSRRVVNRRTGQRLKLRSTRTHSRRAKESPRPRPGASAELRRLPPACRAIGRSVGSAACRPPRNSKAL